MRIRRALAAALVALSAVGAMPTQPDPSWWYDSLDVQAAHDAGLTGAGVKVAVIDDQITPDSAALAGAHVAVTDALVCAGSTALSPLGQAAEGVTHGTAVTQYLVGPTTADFPGGIAPGADVTFYAAGADAVCGDVWPTDDLGRSPFGRAIDQAVTDGNSIISVSGAVGFTAVGLGPTMGDDEVIARAIAAGVVIVAATPNLAARLYDNFPNGANGVVSVAAVGHDGSLVKNPGGVETVVPDVTILAPGIDVGILLDNGTIQVGSGSSMATPMVAGVLALAKQKYPKATGNQLIQALVTATTGSGYSSKGHGFGVIDARAFLAVDPTALPDANPLIHKDSGAPSAAQIEAAGGTTGDVARQPAPEPTSESGGLVGPPIWVVLILVLALLGVLFVVMSRRRRRT